MDISTHLDILGYPVKDKVTSFAGVATSVCFDLYGCIQVAVNPGLDKDGKAREGMWFDILRLDRTSPARVMTPPNYTIAQTNAGKAEGVHGPAEKPAKSY